MSLADANRQYFDSISDTYDAKPWFATVNNQVAEALRGDLSWIGIPFVNVSAEGQASAGTEQVRMLDYACGTGLMTRIFAPYITHTTAIDISPNMISTYTSRFASANPQPLTITTAVGNLFDKSDPNPSSLDASEFRDFDLATVGFGFHHFEDVVYAAKQLKGRLRPGGVLVINDFLEGGDVLADDEGKPVEGSQGNHAVHHHGHGHGHGHKHDHSSHSHKHDHSHGATEKHDSSLHKKMAASIVVPHFTIEGVRQFFSEAGFVDVDVKTMKEKSYMEFGGKKMWRTILFARGRRPAGDNGKEKSEL
ncbi:hypothetical protein COCC4DRAFT_67800 [Bipolaris maydis ATCC 48331]|uniref:Methyltransferase type 12 domain-containing protein n=2 Tax=Cochliobolus heterostrophus TaxID=5016 RepID=M2V7M5_COCH5|nr:uncharacterized protein COCC4DRAFT_67800 [Bipolaris maydis ATCC 48331]EMD96017.1 hypothetical protein COCHEDRAFT_1221672 [Bipolaris maydis C5]KAH7561896.1 hypothetical protein BM1_03000 [Bipolaris maydis]ENI10875.1 hypothetical protein COCC4DRAFT_67800 [Bipolaris maydis ATCC 48331]KAJ5030717.1 S-adenosyl-L-methionine-dependent methyltransferase [Bipolaris maydis]KAJ5065736.1 S-adenosyl-L-methionine-dependent methyltransferase [Bipolaris maydis]